VKGNEHRTRRLHLLTKSTPPSVSSGMANASESCRDRFGSVATCTIWRVSKSHVCMAVYNYGGDSCTASSASESQEG
jgi:hypothetical protein